MQIVLFLIVISLCIAAGFLFSFFWAVRDGQYDDDITPSLRILVDDDMLPELSGEQLEFQLNNNIKTEDDV